MNILDAGNVLEDLINDYGALWSPNIRPIHNLEELRMVYKLTHDCFIQTGHFKANPSKMIVHHPLFDHIPETEIFVAVVDSVIVGSISVTFENPAGFTVEEDFKEQCAAIRSEGQPMATVWRLVVDEKMRSNRAIVMGLIDKVVQRIREQRATIALYAVNPKYEKVYCRLFNMEVVARNLVTDGDDHAPSILLRGDPFKISDRREAHSLVPEFNPIHTLLASSAF